MPKPLMLLPVLALILGGWVQDTPAGFNPDLPTEVDAERAEYFNSGTRVLLEGAVEISQPGVILTADRMEIGFVEGTQDIRELVATGRVRYATVGGDAIAGERALYVAGENRLTVTGNVVVVQEGQVATGAQLTYDTRTGAILMTGGEGGRVRGLISQRTDS